LQNFIQVVLSYLMLEAAQFVLQLVLPVKYVALLDAGVCAYILQEPLLQDHRQVSHKLSAIF